MGIHNKNILQLILGLLLLVSSCGENTEQDKPSETEIIQPTSVKITSVEGLLNNQKLTIGDTIKVRILATGDAKVDSSLMTLGGNKVVATGDRLEMTTSDLLPGKHTIRVEATSTNGKEVHIFAVEMLSDIVPTEYTYQRVTYYTHDPNAFTEGLFYHNGFLYENTGQNGESSLRKVELETGRVLEQVFLRDQYFGEGIALWKDMIFQLTYRAREGFVYTIDGFEQIKSFNFATETSEGWGMTTVDDKLVMSDGSENLYFLDPETLTESKRLKVYDNNGPLKNINELEYIDGIIYANVWLTDYLVTIDLSTGKVLSKIDLTGLMNAQTSRLVKELNGIAYDHNGKRLFVTGKYWPRLYEIRLIEKKPS